MTRGFSLVEVVVALLIFQVGGLATMTLTISALETLRTAEEIERAVTALRLVVDSLATASASEAGEAVSGRITVRWRRAMGTGGSFDAEALVSGRIRARIRFSLGSVRVWSP